MVSTSCGNPTIDRTMSHCAATACGDSAQVAPASMTGWAWACVRLKTTTSWPFFKKFLIIPVPITPVPINPSFTLLILSAKFLLIQRVVVQIVRRRLLNNLVWSYQRRPLSLYQSHTWNCQISSSRYSGKPPLVRHR